MTNNIFNEKGRSIQNRGEIMFMINPNAIIKNILKPSESSMILILLILSILKNSNITDPGKNERTRNPKSCLKYTTSNITKILYATRITANI